MQDHTSLKSLVTALVDARNGYREAVRDAAQTQMKSLFQDMIALHESALVELRAEIEARGESADDSGSFMSTVHETVIAVRSAVTGLDEHSLGGFADGEERIVKSYDRAIDESRDDLQLRETLERQREAIRAKIESMKSAVSHPVSPQRA